MHALHVSALGWSTSWQLQVPKLGLPADGDVQCQQQMQTPQGPWIAPGCCWAYMAVWPRRFNAQTLCELSPSSPLTLWCTAPCVSHPPPGMKVIVTVTERPATPTVYLASSLACTAASRIYFVWQLYHRCSSVAHEQQPA